MFVFCRMYHFFTSGSARGGGIGVIKANAEMPPSTLAASSGGSNASRTSGAAPSSSGGGTSSKPTWSTLDEMCARCNKPLSGSVAKNKGKAFHASCFTCTTCNTQLRGRCINLENATYCEKCGKVAFAKASAATEKSSSSSGAPPRRLSMSSSQANAEAKEADEKRKRIEKQKEMIEQEKTRMSQEARARKEEAEREAREQQARREREEREEAARRENQERARREQEIREREAQERLERVRREREELEREAREKEERKERERQLLLQQERQKREDEQRERQEREQRQRERKAEEERAEAAAREKEAAQRVAKMGLSRGSAAVAAPAPAQQSSETEGMTEWQRIAYEKAKKRSAAGSDSPSSTSASSSPQVPAPRRQHGESQPGSTSSPQVSTPTKSPDWKKKDLVTSASASRHNSSAPKPSSDGPPSRRGSAAPRPVHQEPGTSEWQRKAADVQQKLADHAFVDPETVKPATVVEPPKPISPRPVKETPPVKEASPEPVQHTVTVVSAEEVEVAVATPMRPALPPPRPTSRVAPSAVSEEEPKSPRSRPKSPVPSVVVTPPSVGEEGGSRSPRSPRYSVRPPPAIPVGNTSALKFASFGVTLADIMRHQAAAFPAEKLPRVWTTLVRMLHQLNGLDQEGIFRMSGSSSDIDRLKETLNKGAFDAEFDGDAHVVACALKQWIAELAEPLIPRRVYEETIAAVEVPGGDAAIMPYIYQSLRDLPACNRDVLVAFVALMRDVLNRSSANRMNEANLAICFSPGIFQSLADDPALFVHNSQCETKWVELLLRYPPKDQDLVGNSNRLVAPARDMNLSTSIGTPATKRRGSYLGGKGSGASSSAPNLATGGASKATATNTLSAPPPSTFDTIFHASNSGSASPAMDGSVEPVSNYIVKGDTLQGYLMKENPNGLAKLWKRRWFVLQGKRLLYYAEPRPGRPAGEGLKVFLLMCNDFFCFEKRNLKGFISLARATVSAAPGYAKRDFALVINTPERAFYLQSADAQDLYYWISSLHDVLESPELQGPDSEYTTSAPDAALLPAREYSFAKDAFAGELERLGALKMWKKRHIVLSDGILYSFKRNGDKKPSEKVFLYGSHLEEHDVDLQKSEQCVAFRVRAATGSDIVLRARFGKKGGKKKKKKKKKKKEEEEKKKKDLPFRFQLS
jgi:hypothetical protein